MRVPRRIQLVFIRFKIANAKQCVFLEEYCLFSYFIKMKDAKQCVFLEEYSLFGFEKRVARGRGATPKIGVFLWGVTPGVTPVVTLAFHSEFHEFFTPKGNPWGFPWILRNSTNF